MQEIIIIHFYLTLEMFLCRAHAHKACVTEVGLQLVIILSKYCGKRENVSGVCQGFLCNCPPSNVKTAYFVSVKRLLLRNRVYH